MIKRIFLIILGLCLLANTLIYAAIEGKSASSNIVENSIIYELDGGGKSVTTENTRYIRVNFSGKLTGWTILVDQSGSIKIDVWKEDTWANVPPTDADSITNGHEPEISSAIKGEDMDISDWSRVTFSAGDVFGFTVDSIDTCEWVQLILHLDKD